jgi:hypothetical protein
VLWKAEDEDGGRLPRLRLAGNPSNAVGLRPSQVRAAAVKGLQRWSAAAGGAVGFDYWQGSDSAVFETRSDLNGQNSLFFASQSPGSRVDPNVLGLTEVWYSTQTGEIFETDIVLNDVDYRFDSNLENVITHELGHAFGLSHSGVMLSTMLFVESPDQKHLGCDDQVGIRDLYAPTASALTLRVESLDGSPHLGAHVLALSRKRGTVLRSALSGKDGVARLGSLEAGAYDLVIEPFAAGASSLPLYYSQMSERPCPDLSRFSRLFRTGGFAVTDAGLFDAGTVRVGCSSELKTPDESGSERTVLSWGESGGAAAFLAGQKNNFLRIESSGGDLAVRFLSFSLYSPVRVRATLREDRAGKPGRSLGVSFVNDRPPSRMDSGPSGFSNLDSEIQVRGLDAGIYWLELSFDVPPIQLYPAGGVSLDPLPFFVVQVLRLETGELIEPVDSRCRQDERFAEYSSPPGDPPRRNLALREGGQAQACGRLSDRGAGPGVGLLAIWIFVLYLVKQLSKVALRSVRA